MSILWNTFINMIIQMILYHHLGRLRLVSGIDMLVELILPQRVEGYTVFLYRIQ